MKVNMNRTAFALAVLLAAGCSSGGAEPVDTDPPAPDAGGDVLAPPTTTTTGMAGAAGAGSAGKGGSGGATGGGAGTGGTGGAAGSGGGSAGTGGGAGAGTAGAGSPTIDAGRPDADASAPEASAPEAGGGDGAVPPADAATADVRNDAGTDAGVAPICPSPSAACDEPNRSDAAIRATYVQPCGPDGLQKCGGIDYGGGVIDTLPMVCRSAMWRLAGTWSGSQWVAAYSCSGGCAAGKLCDP